MWQKNIMAALLKPSLPQTSHSFFSSHHASIMNKDTEHNPPDFKNVKTVHLLLKQSCDGVNRHSFESTYCSSCWSSSCPGLTSCPHLASFMADMICSKSKESKPSPRSTAEQSGCTADALGPRLSLQHFVPGPSSDAGSGFTSRDLEQNQTLAHHRMM